MALDDIYPEGHQGGVCIIMNGHRVATNGDIHLKATPGQWQQTKYVLGEEAPVSFHFTPCVSLIFVIYKTVLQTLNPNILPVFYPPCH